jgi:hypothetical protein
MVSGIGLGYQHLFASFRDLLVSTQHWVALSTYFQHACSGRF